MEQPSFDRRPIAARGSKPAVFLADLLIRARASPNMISVAGMICALAAGGVFALAPGHAGLWLLGAVLVQARLLANLLDGMVAIGRGIASPVGELFNEVPDRVSDTAVLIGLGAASGTIWLGLAAALAAMATAYVRAVGKGCGLPSDFSGPMAKQHRMAAVTVAAIVAALFGIDTAGPALWIILLLSVLTAGRRLWRIAQSLDKARA